MFYNHLIKTVVTHYKNLQNKECRIDGFEGLEYAVAEYKETIELFEKYGSMDKDEFIAKMKVEHPEKYD